MKQKILLLLGLCSFAISMKAQVTELNVLPSSQEVCIGTTTSMTSDFTLSGTDTFQWQSSPDKATWQDVAGATTRTYNPVDQPRGVIFYRLVVKDSAGTEIQYSDPAIVRVMSCSLPVNNNITIMGYGL